MKRLSVILFLLPFALHSFVPSTTVYRADKTYVTKGEVDFSASLEEVALTLLKYNDYNSWFLAGLDGTDKESEGLIAWFTDISYRSDEGLFYVIFDINLIWPFGSRGNRMKFDVEQKFDDQGELEELLLKPRVATRLVEKAVLALRLRSRGEGAAVAYEAQVKLAPFVDFFFSLKSYRKNFEWYIDKVASNLAAYLQ